MRKSALSTARVASLVVGLFGAAMATHWVFRVDAIARLIPGSERAGIVSPLLFVASGICLFNASRPSASAAWLNRLAASCIAALIALPLAYLFETASGIGLGIDAVRAGTVPTPSDPHPGRLPLDASLAFLLAGIAFWLNRRQPTRLHPLVFPALALTVSVIGIGGLVGNFVGIETLYQVASFNRPLPTTAFGLSVVGAGLWMLHEAALAFDPKSLHKTEQRIKRRSIAIITLVALAGGVAGFAVMRDTFERSVSNDMLLIATTNAASLGHTIEVSLLFPKSVATRPAARQALDKLSRSPDDTGAMDFLQRVAESALTNDLTRVEIYAANGARVAQAGSLPTKTQLIQRLANTEHTTFLTWKDGYRLLAEAEVRIDGRLVGKVLTEQRMPLFDHLLSEIRAASNTSDAAICGRDSDRLICAPNRYRPSGFELPMFDATGAPGLPVARALLGESGVQVLKDRRGATVLSAFTPINTFGLGLAVRTDVDTLYAPMRSHLNTLALVLVGIVALAILAQHRQVRPVLKQLVASEQLVKAILENQSELVSLATPEGELTYVNPAYARHFGRTPSEMLGHNMYDDIAPADHQMARSVVADVLATGTAATSETRVTSANGTERWVAWTHRLLPEPSGRPTLHSVGRDVTERMLAERALRTLAAIFDATTDYVVQNDAQGRLIYMNPAARHRFGLAPDAPLDALTLDHFNPPQTLEKLNAEVGPSAEATGVWVGESRVRDAGQREFPVSHIVICHRDQQGQVEYFSSLMRDISAAKAAEQAVRDSEHRLRMVTDNLPVLISYLDRDLRFQFVNRTYQQWFGSEAAPPVGTRAEDFYGEQAWLEIGPRLRAALEGQALAFDLDMTRLDASRHVQVTVVPDRDERGAIVGLYSLISDVTSYREAQRALQESEARLRTVADALPMRVAYIDAEERYRFNNLAYERGFGRPRNELYGQTVRAVLGEAAYKSVEPHIRKALQGEPVTFQSEMATGGDYVCYEAQYIPQRAADGSTLLGFHAVVSDITRQKLEEKRLTELARVDPLTGLVNRAGFELRVAEAMQRCRASGALLALMYLDIDHFKQINDRHGHNTGDALLRAFASRLSQTVRSTDTVARLGGDEFTVIMEGLPRPEVASMVAAKIVNAMGTPLFVGEQAISVTTSIGLAFYQGDATTVEALVQQADVMLYRAKGAGRNNVQTALRLIEGGRT